MNPAADTFKDRLLTHLLSVCSGAGYLDGVLLATPDIDAAWERLAPDYLGDAVREFNGYPEYTLACAGFLGMAVAHLWDTDLPRFRNCTFADFLGPRGFDDMDDFITGTLLQPPAAPAASAPSVSAPGPAPAAPAAPAVAAPDAPLPGVAAMQTCAGEAYHFLMRENAEPGTAGAYRQFLATAEAMFRFGAAIELRRLGYKLVAVTPAASTHPS
ncbi:MAG: hypothetical protein IJM00_05980 [Bacteroidales bacterium]|nr:hypothetical protein [Bacteroidales bacterium]